PADGDEQRRRYPAMNLAAEQRGDGAGQRGEEVDGDGDWRDEQVEHELVTRLAGIERIVEHALLGHEHVGREQRAEDERKAARHVENERNQPLGAGYGVWRWHAGSRVNGVTAGDQR